MEKTYKWRLDNAGKTRDFAAALAAMLAPGDFLSLEGDLGAGKTTFTQGLAQGLGIKGAVNSPTFTIMKEYAGRLPLYHFDVYRVGEDIESVGADEYFYGDGVCVVEWASLIEAWLPQDRLTIMLGRGDENDVRFIALSPQGKRYVELCEEFERNAGFGDRHV
ncbi:tRNA (adenosine(37)-N6)-threonylcarbamoyltransferase complex ATPase subunit type 1 TsaE [Brevibacillus fluminis]|uniref:tRNA threonylcarbamoyladenosine biosynthesis protein TsaE n=1 Tax=Brevibacillus fluminis TaxID=511487 RepID=A0A3M8DTV1_9BACL|nr:tRNA (adenosine(37)-N6)-threonylcarbamoyltransferase complex ATPase subunit type 1 TsaE [Brevibacillus fluminis]RNB91502.1 tRNA (adenosine(37)-N6)-threonylcarbamoyltransferase complex ATPase subunit type 1 TsaE [Brevibacillus fluminis]